MLACAYGSAELDAQEAWLVDMLIIREQTGMSLSDLKNLPMPEYRRIRASMCGIQQAKDKMRRNPKAFGLS